jgi:dephospho-CoA kinase
LVDAPPNHRPADPPAAPPQRGTAPFVGLTGGIAAGKSEALAAFERHGAATLSSDLVVHELLDDPETRGRLVERWGERVLADGRVSRERVGEIVFERPDELAWLESLLHPLVGDRIVAWRGDLDPSAPVAVVEVPLLFETGLETAFDATICVVAADQARARRAGERGIELLEGRSSRQLSQDEKAARATYLIRNDGSLADLEREVVRLIGLLAEKGAA